MNFQQLEYVLAVDTHRNFVRAAQSIPVSQPTLSMMIQKLEDELGLRIFERNRRGVEPTREGVEMIRRIREIANSAAHLKEFAAALRHDLSGDLRLGIIPTLAPYLVPLFLKPFSEKYPQIRLHLKEITTDRMIEAMRTGQLDMGLAAGPLGLSDIVERPLFHEEFFAYASQNSRLSRKKYLLPNQIDPSKLWLLEEGHCLRSQIFDLCELKKREMSTASNVIYEAGSIETLVNLVDQNEGITIIPQLAAMQLKAEQRPKLREFAPPKPMREVVLLATRNFPRLTLLEKLADEIRAAVPLKMGESSDLRRVLAMKK